MLPSRAKVSAGEKLLQQLGLCGNPIAAQSIDPEHFPIKVPLPFARRISPNNADDPLLRQILPSREELVAHPLFSADPTHDDHISPVPGILHKYPNRVLLIASANCPIHCRYCFRRHFSYPEPANTLQGSIDYIAADQNIEEVILSGGDPLSLTNKNFFSLCKKIENINHIQRIRIHSRYPVAVPERLNSEWVSWSKQRRKPYLMVVHINHPNEIDNATKSALSRMQHWPLLNQSVLLKGVNDSAATLAELSKTCFNAGILPYYLHLLDKVAGTTHFWVTEERAAEIMRELNSLLPGYLVPKLVCDRGDRTAKSTIHY